MLTSRNRNVRVVVAQDASKRPYAPWGEQRKASIKRDALITAIVAGRQSGKSFYGAHGKSARAAGLKPNGVSCLLTPTYKIAEMPKAHLKVMGANMGAVWKQMEHCLIFPNGHKFYVRSADRPDCTRGLTITGLLWIDEAAYVSEAAFTAALGCLGAAEDPEVLLTTTPCGRNWVFNAWQDEEVVRFRFRSEDSPYANLKVIKQLRSRMSMQRAAQEFDAVFTGDVGVVFRSDDLDRLFVPRMGAIRGERLALGVDLGKEHDYTVLILMNEFGEAWMLGRWRHVAWPETHRKIENVAKFHDAVCVVDASGGYGNSTVDYLTEAGCKVLPVKTGVIGTKAQIVEALQRDVEFQRVRVELGDPPKDDVLDMRHEMTFFMSTRKRVAGREVVTYEGPQTEDDHDDTVISLALANWGRLHGWDGVFKEKKANLKSFVKSARKSYRGSIFRRR